MPGKRPCYSRSLRHCRHGNMLTAFQVWVNYRVAVMQLNLYHPGRAGDPGCQQLRCCQGEKETVEHIFWSCPCAQACWQKLICHWTGERWAFYRLSSFLANCASRLPPLSAVVRGHLSRDHPDDVVEYADVWRRMWRILCSVCVTYLWIQRN